MRNWSELQDLPFSAWPARKFKRYMNNFKKRAGYGKYVIDCRYHPCIVTATEFYKSDPWGNGIFVKSLVNDTPFGCSLLHCGIKTISKEEAEERASYIKTHSFDAYMEKYYANETR